MREDNFDILVAGGGIAGTIAAIAAASEGARTLLMERYAALGGMATLGLVQPITM
jgi:flavin-dependent dehydrogenase